MDTERAELLSRRLAGVQAEYGRRCGRRDQLLEELRAKEERRAKAEEEGRLLEEVGRAFHAASEMAREAARGRAESAVTDALQAIFGPELSFKVDVVERRGRPEAEFSAVTDLGGESLATPVLDARGGGVVDVASLALRVLAAAAASPEGSPVILDEPGKHLSEGYSRALGELLGAVAAQTGRQVVAVTHDPRVAEAADAVYRVEMESGVSRARKVS